MGRGNDVYSVPIDASVAERARLLAELAVALDQAESLLISLPPSDDRRELSVELYVRIQAARLEVETLRRSRSLVPRNEIDPERTKSSPWAPETFGS